ncbi:MAG: phenylacetate--CoA ligase family protein [Deltaproteobacteria bacterium]|nr:phenylacetate--CoA ligase family protein [Deltaproteobacteria bacterium]
MSAREVQAFSTELLAAYGRNSAPRSVVVDVQQRRLARLLEIARRTHAYRDLRTLADAPVVDKATLMASFDDHMVDRAPSRVHTFAFLGKAAPGALLDDRFIVTTTSGTTGEVGVFVVDDVGFARLRATVFARIFRGQLRAEGFALLLRRRYRMTFVVAVGGHTMTAVLALRRPRIGGIVADVRTLSIDDPLPQLVSSLNSAPPLLLHTYATVLEVLAHEALRGRLRIDPEIVTAGSEPLTLQARAVIGAAFPRATLVETWGATEHVGLATACNLGHLHINEDAAILEAVDDDDRPVPDGAWSERVLVTNLLNHAQPVLRYRLDDRVRIDGGLCPCGSPFRRVEIVGRTDDVVYLDDGQCFQAHTPIPFEIALLGVPGLLQFALVHEEQNRLRVSVVVEDGASGLSVSDLVCERLERYFAEHGLTEHVSFVVEETASLSRHARSKKLRQITSRVPKPAASKPAALRRLAR